MLTLTPTNDPVHNTSLIANAIATVGPNGMIHLPNMAIPHNGITLPYPVFFQGEGQASRYNTRGTILQCMDNTKNNIAFATNVGASTDGAVFSDLTLLGGFWGLEMGSGPITTNFTLERVSINAGVSGGGGIHCGRPMERLFWKNVVVESPNGTYGVLFDESTITDFSDRNGAYIADSLFERLWVLGGLYNFVINTPNSRPWFGVKWTELRLTQAGTQPFFAHCSATRLTFDGVSTELSFVNGVPAGMVKAGMIFKTTSGEGMGQIIINLPAFADGRVDIPITNVQNGGGAELVIWNDTGYSPTTNYPAPSNLYIPPI